jgi:Zn-dependent M28 family amino/carboxypeptidase
MNRDKLSALDRAICGDIYAGDAARRNLEFLCLECNGRFAGSPDDRRAADLVSRLWREYGLSDVHMEPFTFTAWQRGSASLEMTVPAAVPRRYPCLALPYAPRCDLEADLLDLDFGIEADFTRAGQAARGKIVLVKNGVPPGVRPMHRLEKYRLASDAGAAAFVFSDNEPGMLAPTGSLLYLQTGPTNQGIPGIGVALEVGLELGRWAKRAPVRLRLTLDNELRPGTTSWNVVGELGGSDPHSSQILLVGAHLDGHDIAQAAIDNGSGVIAVTEVARALGAQWDLAGFRDLPCAVRFICFGAEELGMIGSYAYASAHEGELDRVRFFFNLDCVGSAGQVGIHLQDSPELMPVFQALCRELEPEVIVSEHLVPFSDQFPFTVRGVPSAFIATFEGPGGRGWGHTAADTLDKVNVQGVRAAAAAVARLVVRLATDSIPAAAADGSPEPGGTARWPGRRRSSAEVRDMLVAGGLEPLMRAEGVWLF